MHDSRFSDRLPPSFTSELLRQEGSMLVGIIRFTQAVRERKKIPILCAITFCVVGLVYYAVTPRIYDARAEVLLKGDNGRDSLILISEPMLAKLAGELSEEQVAELDELPQPQWAAHIRNNLVTKSPGGRQKILKIRYASRDPQAAKIILEKLVNLFVSHLNRDFTIATNQSMNAAALRRPTTLNLVSMMRNVLNLRPVMEDDLSPETIPKDIKRELREDSTSAQSSSGKNNPAKQAVSDISSSEKPDHQVQQSGRFANEIQNITDKKKNGVDQLLNKNGAIILAAPVVPSEPSTPIRLTLILPIAGFLGLGLGMGIVFVLDAVDDRFRSPGELCRQLGLPLLGTIHKRKVLAQSHEKHPPYENASKALEIEEFQSLHLALDLFDKETKILVVSSIDSGDGKTAISARLASAFAKSGKRTLLIDADFRNRGLSRLFGAKEEKGLSQIISEEYPVSNAADENILCVGSSRLEFLPCGEANGDSIGLLTTKRFSEFLGWCGKNYDQVLIDAPPALPATEAVILGKTTDGIILVLRPDRTTQSRTVRACRNLNTFGCHIIGIVANLLEPHGHWLKNEGYGFVGTGIPQNFHSFDTPVVPLPSSPGRTPSQKEEQETSRVIGLNEISARKPRAA